MQVVNQPASRHDAREFRNIDLREGGMVVAENDQIGASRGVLQRFGRLEPGFFDLTGRHRRV